MSLMHMLCFYEMGESHTLTHHLCCVDTFFKKAVEVLEWTRDFPEDATAYFPYVKFNVTKNKSHAKSFVDILSEVKKVQYAYTVRD